MISPDAPQADPPASWPPRDLQRPESSPGTGGWLDALLSRISEGVTVHDAGGQLLFANARISRVLGGLDPATLTDVRGADAITFEDEAGVPVPLHRLPPFCADAEGVPVERLCSVTRGDGRRRWIQVRSERICDGALPPLTLTLWRDVTRQRMRQSLSARREALLSAQRTSAREGTFAFSARGRLLHWNNALLELLRIPEPSLQSRNVEPVLQALYTLARDPQPVRSLLGTARPRERTPEQIVPLRDGRSLAIVRAPLRGTRGELHGQAWFIRDATLELHSAARDRLIALEHAALTSSETSRRRYELLARLGHLLASRELGDAVTECLRSVAAHFGDAAVLDLVDADGPGVRRRMEVSRSALEPLAPGLEDLASAEPGAECIRWAVRRASRARLHGLDPNEYATRPSLWVFGAPAQLGVLAQMGVRRVMGVPVRTRAQIRGFLTVLGGGDDSPFSAEDERLLEEIAVRFGFALERDEALERARRAVAARDEFIASASHELRTPLSTLLLTLQGVARQLAGHPELVPQWVRTRIDSAVRQANQLRDLVDRLMDVTRLASGRIRLNFEKVELHVLVAELAEEVAELAADAGCTLHARAEAVSCVTDRARLRQALSSLIENACKYGRGAPITLEVRRARDCVEIAVTDGGPGVPPEDRERIFGRFERAAPQGVRGHGLGLYILREVVEALGGTVRLDTGNVRGATFRIRLPPEGPRPN